MGFPNSMQNTGNVSMVAGSFNGGTTPTILSGSGFSCSYGGGNFTCTLDRQYDGVISIVATVHNGGLAAGNSGYAVVKSHSVVADTNGGNFVINLIDDAGNIQSSFEDDIEVHFIALLKEDT